MESEGKDEKSKENGVSESVLRAISELIRDDVDDPFCRADFDVVAHINTLFPTEQSLSQLEDVMKQIQTEIVDLDAEIAELVQSQSDPCKDGQAALQEAKRAMNELFHCIRDIQTKTEHSESMVKEITRDIKQLDIAKRNLTSAITTLHHLQILLTGLDCLRGCIDQNKYADIAAHLPVVLNVLVLFQPYMAVPQVNQLADQVDELKKLLSGQVCGDFREALSGGGVPDVTKIEHIMDICRVVSVLDPALKIDLINWFIEQQLREYTLLYADTEDIAWLDRIDQRYRWFISKLTHFEKTGMDKMFPSDWQMARRLATAYCTLTRDMLDRLMTTRILEIDAKLLSYAVNHTAMFESLLCKRFPGQDAEKSPFDGIIWRVFECRMHVYVSAQDKNMKDFLDQCAGRMRTGEDRKVTEMATQAYPLPSSADVFLFLKKIIQESVKLSTDPDKLLNHLVPVFKKCLRGYAFGCLTPLLPKVSSGGGGLLHSLLREEGEMPRLTKDEQFLSCCIVATADWCAETTQQLQDKLREKIGAVDMNAEMDVFYNISSSALILLVQDLESACHASLQAMTKINWSAVESVGDESAYVSSIRSHLKRNVPLIRQLFGDRRKYFGHFCLKFATQFMAKYVGALFRCRPMSVSAAEQLLLDTHALKTFLLNLPNIQSSLPVKPPNAYLSTVNKAMTKAEMILKIVMSDMESCQVFIENYARLLPESDDCELQKVLEMKGVRRSEQTILLELYQGRYSAEGHSKNMESAQVAMRSVQPAMQLAALTGEDSRIKKLERLVMKKL